MDMNMSLTPASQDGLDGEGSEDEEGRDRGGVGIQLRSLLELPLNG